MREVMGSLLAPSRQFKYTNQRHKVQEESAMQEYIVNLWTQDREASQPISMATFQNHINAESGSNAPFDSMWARMQTIIGKYVAASTLLLPMWHCKHMLCLRVDCNLVYF